MSSQAKWRSRTGDVLEQLRLAELALADVVAGQGRHPGERQLAAVVTRRRVGRGDQLDAAERLLGFAPHELAAGDRGCEVVEQRVEPAGMARVHPVGADRLSLEAPARLAVRRADLGGDLDAVILDPDRAMLTVNRVEHLADARVPRQVGRGDS